MRTDVENWSPLSVLDVAHLFSPLPIRWGIAGGWALDLHYGKQTREHSDTDVILSRADQEMVYHYLKPDWILYRAEKGKLTLWEGEYLHDTNDIWVSRDEASPFAFQMMIINIENDKWLYKRNNAIQRPASELFLTTPEGIPYLRPEIQLLHKGGSSQVREKDFKDLMTHLPLLEPAEKEWLKSSLRVQFPAGHDWINYMDAGE
ncbi:nucleotidyltransferase domain-containing protein [Paenibacillus glycanilyticus]|uniref:Amino acid transporter n=1 Tax=Paenibacillus glycanilyticus TaxID=126569 RepID=A0ABQ6G718_9BACL|nr:hypothetical protein [Paenibacillus glycanilyticus]GLX66764.1 hypothetical protein MU1_11080 [Paenibacillus glycanilyticus]